VGAEPEENNGAMVWMDLEMTGLDPDQDEIIEIATLITDAELNVIAEGPELVIHQPEKRFAKMDDWNQEHHTKSGLWAAVLKSEISMADAEQQTLAFLKQHIGERTSPLCGNSIWQDRRFLARHMPRLEAYLHYRLVDVSTIKELTRRWYPDLGAYSKKVLSHRALDDIRESIAELKFYREKLFRDLSEVK
jgi:oligoribonuclease